MHGLTQIWDYLSSEGGGKAMVDARQDYVQALIAGVRRLLVSRGEGEFDNSPRLTSCQEHCNCLHRDDDQIVRHAGLRRARKGLLAELATLIKCRHQIQDTFSGTTSADFDFSWPAIDDYMDKAFKVACRGITFLDIWIQGGPKRLRIVSSFDQRPESVSDSDSTPSFSPTSPAHMWDSPVDDAHCGAEETKDVLSWIHRDRAKSHDSHHSESSRESADVQTSEAQLRSSVLFNSQPKCCLPEERTDSEDLASEQLSAVHDHLLGHIGTFLGLHLQPRNSLDLASATQYSLRACTGLIAIVKEIWINDPQASPVVYDAMHAMQNSMETLAKAARDLCRSSGPLEDPALLRPEQGKILVVAATACVRAAGDCTSKTRLLLDNHGDFVIDMDNVYQHQLMITLLPKDDDFVSIGSSVASTASHQDSAEEFDDDEDLPPPVPEKDPLVVRPLHVRSNTAPTTILDSNSDPNQRPSPLTTPHKRARSTASDASLSPPVKNLGMPVVSSSHSRSSPTDQLRKTSTGESTSMYESSLRDSTTSGRSPTSTRATTPERSTQTADLAVLNRFCSNSSMKSRASDSDDYLEAEILAKSYAHELLYNKEGQVLGGTLRALVEKLTAQHSTPDPTLLSTFYLTFRQFTSSVDLAQALIDRFHYVEESSTESMPVRLRIYNFMKGWLEAHWFSEHDNLALSWIRDFATSSLKPILPGPGKRLEELVELAYRLNMTNAATQLIKPVKKATLSSSPMPSPVISKSQLKLAHSKAVSVSITDFDPLEIARQYTLTGSSIFCDIEAEELLNLNWTKNAESAANVRAMARYATDLTNVVADSILSIEDTKKRVIVVKHWIKIGKACLDLENYDCVMAIVCSLASSPIIRLRATWDQVQAKWKAQFNELKNVVDVSRNYAGLRQRLQSAAVPCLPFVGIYLTDLTFVDAGNQDTRILPSSDDTVQPVEVINFDKHMRTARIITQLQRFQVAYRLQPVTELQSWLEAQMSRVRGSDDCSMQAFWRRSLKLEPRALDDGPHGGRSDVTSRAGTSGTGKLGHKMSMSGMNGVFSRDILSTLGFKSEGELKAKIVAGAV